MGALITDIHQAIEVLPGHRRRNTRSKSLHLDDLLDGANAKFSNGARDFLFMAYRYMMAEQHFAKTFFKKPPKSEVLEDYCRIAFSSLLSRDQIPSEVIAHEIVESSKRDLPAALVGVLNAYCRRIVREKGALQKLLQNEPGLLLSPALKKRWTNSPDIIRHLGTALQQRPPAGIWAFNSALEYQKHESQGFLKSTSPLQAMNPGSAKLMQNFFNKFPFGEKAPIKILDFCAAPGAKLLWSIFEAKKNANSVSATAIEQKHPRMERLKENIKRFELSNSVETLLLSIGEEPLPASVTDPIWDLVLVDLPCSGSGTLASRPDLLNEDILSRFAGLQKIQAQILGALLQLKFKSALVSICSVDPEECQGISKILKKDPDFRPWQFSEDSADDGLTAWFL